MTTTFIEILPEYRPEPAQLPTCPDGSGDLWWDDASYIRYQSWDAEEPLPERIQGEVYTDDYCDGVPQFYSDYLRACHCHRAIYDSTIPF